MPEQNRRMRKSLCWGFMCLALLLNLASCSQTEEDPDASVQLNKLRDQQIDASDSILVAKAFFNAIRNNNVDAAANEILPEQRSQFKRDMETEDEVPCIPPVLRLEIESISEKRAYVTVVNGTLGLELIYEDGRWWVAR